jgi:hypothetical protein
MSRCSVESVELKKSRDLEFDFVVFWLRGFLYQNFSYLGALKLFCFAQICGFPIKLDCHADACLTSYKPNYRYHCFY